MCFRLTLECELWIIEEELVMILHHEGTGGARTAEKSVVFPASGQPVRATTGRPLAAPFPAREAPSGDGQLDAPGAAGGETYS